MIKKLGFILIVCIIAISTVSFGYEANDFKIDIPQSFKSTDIENIFADEEGNLIGISISEIAYLPYTEENLEKIINTLTKDLDSRREEIKDKIYIEYGNVLTEEYIESYARNVNISVQKKEIATFGSGNYKCFHYIVNVDMIENKYYAEFYQTCSGGKTYTITISSKKDDYFESDDIKNTIKSFEIKNYEEPKDEILGTSSEANSKYRKTEKYLIIACAMFAFLGLMGLKKDKNNNTNKEEK